MGITIVTVLAAGVELGIAAGIAYSILCLLMQVARPHVAEIGQIEGTEHYRNIKRHEVTQDPHTVSIRFDERLHFLNSQQLEDTAGELLARPDLKHVILHCGAINQVDASGLDALEAVNERLNAAGICLHLSEVKGPVMDRLKHSDLLEHLGGSVHLSHHQATQAVRAS